MNAHPYDQPIAADELERLFRPHRPDAAEFRAAIDRRIAEGAQREQAQRADEPRLLRRVASLLPPDLAVLTGAKGLGAVLALPALLLASALGAFAFGVSSLRRTQAGKAPAASARGKKASGAFLGALHVATFALCAVSLAFGGRHVMDVVMAVLVVSMAALALLSRLAGAGGALTRGQALRIAGSLLLTVFLAGFLNTGSLVPAEHGSVLQHTWSALIVLVGALGCAFAAPRHRVALLVGGGAWMVLLSFALPPVSTRSSPEAVRRLAGEIEVRADALAHWQELSALVEALDAIGARRPDLSRLEPEIERALGDPGDVHPWVWTAAERMGLMTTERWQRLIADGMQRYRVEQLTASDGRLYLPEYYAYSVAMLLATHELEPEERELLLRRVRSSWPGPDRSGALEDAAVCLRILRWLDAADEIEALRPAAQRLLVHHWIAERHGFFSRSGGFSAYPDKIHSSIAGPTLTAIEIAGFVGMPSEIDLGRLHGYLQGEARGWGLVFDVRGDLHAIARAALLRLEREIGLPQRSPLEELLAQRMWIAAILLVLLCWYAVYSSTSEPRGPGALP